MIKILYIAAIALIIMEYILGRNFSQSGINIREYYVFSIIGFIAFAFFGVLCGFAAVIVTIFQKEPFKGQGYRRIYKTLFVLIGTYLLVMMLLASTCYFLQFENSLIDCMLSFYSLTEDSIEIKSIGLTEIATGFIFNTVFVGMILTFFQRELDKRKNPMENLDTLTIESGGNTLEYKLIEFRKKIQKLEGIQYMTIEKDEQILVYELVKCEKKKSI